MARMLNLRGGSWLSKFSHDAALAKGRCPVTGPVAKYVGHNMK